MIDHDRLFKELLTTFFAEFLGLFAPSLAAAVRLDAIEMLDKEILTDVPGAERHVVDLLARLRLHRPDDLPGPVVLVHVENQGRRESEFARRMFRYFAALTLRFEQPIYPVAVFAYDAPGRREPHHHVVRLPGLDVLRFRFRAIQLNRLSWRSFLEHPNPVASALMARMRMRRADRPHVKTACLRMMAGLELNPVQKRLISAFVDTYLKLDAREETIFRREVAAAPDGEKIMEIVTSWMEEGMARGRQEGREQGREEGREQGREEGRRGEAARIARAQLVRKVGAIPIDLDDRLSSLDLAGLEALTEALLEFGSVAELRDWLEQRT